MFIRPQPYTCLGIECCVHGRHMGTRRDGTPVSVCRVPQNHRLQPNKSNRNQPKPPTNPQPPSKQQRFPTAPEVAPQRSLRAAPIRRRCHPPPPASHQERSSLLDVSSWSARRLRGRPRDPARPSQHQALRKFALRPLPNFRARRARHPDP